MCGAKPDLLSDHHASVPFQSQAQIYIAQTVCVCVWGGGLDMCGPTVDLSTM